MPTGITNDYSNHATAYADSAKKTNSGAAAASEKETANNSVSDYYSDLQKKYHYLGRQENVCGVPTTVTVSNGFLQKCVDDPEKAAWLERNLAAIPEGTTWANNYLKSLPGNPVRVYQSISIDENGNMSMCSRSTNDPDGKIAKANAGKKAQEKKEAQEKLAQKRAQEKEEKEAAMERLSERRAEDREQEAKIMQGRTTGLHTVIKTGTEIKSIFKDICAAISGAASDMGFDAKI